MTDHPDIAALIRRLRAVHDGLLTAAPTVREWCQEAADALAALSLAAQDEATPLRGGQVPREPTEAMMQAAVDYMPMGVWPGSLLIHGVWRAMYDAALAERGKDQSDVVQQGANDDDDGTSANRREQSLRSVSVERAGSATGLAQDSEAGRVHDADDQRRAKGGGQGIRRFFDMTREEMKAWLNKFPDDPPACPHGIMAGDCPACRASSDDPTAPAPPESGIVGEIDWLLEHGDSLTAWRETIMRARDRIALLEQAINGPLGWKAEYASDLRLHEEQRKRIASLEAEVARWQIQERTTWEEVRTRDERIAALESELARAKPVIEHARASAEDADDGDLSPFVQKRLMRLRESIRAYDKERE